MLASPGLTGVLVSWIRLPINGGIALIRGYVLLQPGDVLRGDANGSAEAMEGYQAQVCAEGGGRRVVLDEED